MTIIHVGSQNQTKIRAVEDAFRKSSLYDMVDVRGVDAGVEEFGHPKSIEETIDGAKQRALAVFDGSAISVGLESGFVRAPETKAGYLESTACVLYDGEKFAVGMSPAYEWPPRVTQMILGGLDGSQAFRALGLTDQEKVGAAEGAIYTLTHGKTNRTKLNELAVMMALLQYENPEIY